MLLNASFIPGEFFALSENSPEIIDAARTACEKSWFSLLCARIRRVRRVIAEVDHLDPDALWFSYSNKAFGGFYD